MKKYQAIAFALLASLTSLITSCKDESWDKKDEPLPDDTEYGTISLAQLRIEITGLDVSVISRATEIELNDFIIEIKKSDTGEAAREPISYGSLQTQNQVSLPVGSYKVFVHSGSISPSDFNAPYYEGESEVFTIENNKLTVVETITCNVANMAVMVTIADDLLNKIDDINETFVTVYSSPDYPLIYGAEQIYYTDHNGEIGYFEYKASTMVAIFESVIDGNLVTLRQNLSQLEKGQLRNITYSVKEPEVEPTPGTGTADKGFSIDVYVEDEEIGFTVSDENKPAEDEPTIDPDEIVRPGDDDHTDEPQEEPSKPDDNQGGDQPEQPVEDPIKFSSEYLDVEGVNQASEFGEDKKPAVLSIDVPAGITHVNVVIDSPLLPADELDGIGLKDNFDLANPGDLENALKDLGFIPEDGVVKGKTKLDFDITKFVPLLSVLGTGESKFIITVEDAKGNRKSVTLVILS